MVGRVVAGFTVGVATLLALPLLPSGSAAIPSSAALTEIPPAFLALYQEAASRQCPGLPWSVLAAIGKIESNHGRIGGARVDDNGNVAPPILGPVLDGTDGTARIEDSDGGRLDGDPQFDRAVGPMQFIPGTWFGFGIDASGDGIPDPNNATDAIHSAAAYLCANEAGDPVRLVDALLAYNRSSEYVRDVLALATRYEAFHVSTAVPSDTLIAMVLANPRLSIYEAGRRDIADGRIDARVLLFLRLASESWTLGISSLQTGHSKCVGGGNYAGCNVSHHWYGRAVDIHSVNGLAVSSRNMAARALTEWALGLPADLRPGELGNPWTDLSSVPGAFSDGDHRGHLHAGWESAG